jgi:murein DD-endopeptidase MepM/ murein hydrolase activator NlpD
VGAGLAAALLLVACARSGPPAPVENRAGQSYGRPSAPAVAAAPAPAVDSAGTATVQPGETLYALSRRTATPTRAIIEANGLKPPYALQPGQRLALPRARAHEVQPGDTLYGISRRYGVDASALARASGLAPPYVIQVGQRLALPDSVTPPTAPVFVAAAPIVAAAAVTTRGEAKSETVRGAARIEETPLPPPGKTAPAPPLPSASIEPPSSASALPKTAALPAQSEPAVAAEPQAQPYASAKAEPAQIEEPGRGVEPEPASPATPARLDVPPRSGRVFQWPLRGTVLSDYGPKERGLHNDGINISAPQGAPIRAAENGVVVYAGNELRGFGNLLLIRHADGWVTAYAHAEQVLVARGDQVKRGQVVARVGKTGNVSSPQLHFEIRRGTRAVNPREFLAPVSAASGSST